MNIATRSIRRCATAFALLVTAAVAAFQCLAAAESRPFAWKVTGRQGAIYLVGSVHLLTKDFYPLHAALEAAYQDTDHLVEEVDFAEMLGTGAQFAMLSKGMQ